MKTDRRQLILIVAAIVICAGHLALGGVLMYANGAKAEENSVAADEIIQLTNNYRHSLGLNELSINPRLTQAAIDHAKDIIAKQYFDHTTPDGKKFSGWVKDVGYKYFYVGENLAIDFDNSQEVFDAWLKSDGHRANLERKEYQEIGVASLRGLFDNRPASVVVQIFGSRVLGANELGATKPYGINNYFSSANSLTGERSVKAISLCRAWLNWLFIIIVLLLFLTFISAPEKTSAAMPAPAKPLKLKSPKSKKPAKKSKKMKISNF